jgi:hypothetical protein
MGMLLILRSEIRCSFCWLDFGFASGTTYYLSVEINQGGPDIRAPSPGAIFGE